MFSGEKSFHFPKFGRALPRTKPENSPSTGHWNSNQFEIPGIIGFFSSLCLRSGSIFAINVPLISLAASTISCPSDILCPSLTYLLIACDTCGIKEKISI